MRKYQQKQLLELTKTLDKAHAAIESTMGVLAQQEKINDLFANCQDLAVNIGMYIDSLAGEGTQTVALIKEYCEILFHLGQKTTYSNLIKLKEQLIHINNSIYSQLTPNKLEVVFLPYKVAMSDSLESIWQAALNDPSCDAYIIPVPYFERNNDGTFGQMCYEGDLYPDNVPITNWQEYDIEKRHPDIIFTHLPYDEGNHVTSLHPNFYSSRLRKFTDLLVYVPYFVCVDDVQEELCFLNGTVYADKVIVQSEKVRQTYIRKFKEVEEEYNRENMFGNLDEKIIALGSPKFDKVLNTKRENCAVPDEWRRLIEKPDGTSKKIILYNTVLGAILHGNEQYLKKLLSVFELFRKREDVVLWWRPHPLSKATYQSMRPRLREAYERIISEYRRGGWGIYDDSPDLHRAIAVSDGYFGDGSSLVALYEVTGKPMLHQHINHTEHYTAEQKHEQLYSDIIHFGKRLIEIDEFKRIYPEYYEYWLPYRNSKQTSRFVALADYEYGTSSFINAIYKLDEENAKAEYFKSFPADDVNAWLYHPPFRIGNKMLFIPARSREWAFYDMNTDEWAHEPVPEEYCPSKALRAAFGGPVVYGDDIIILPGESGAMAKYNIATGKTSYYQEWYTELSGDIKNADWGTISSVLVYGESILLTSPQSNTIIELNPETMRVTNTYCVGNDNCGIKAAVLIPHTDTVYFIKYREPKKQPWTETIVKWSIKTGGIKEFNDLPINLTADKTHNALSLFIFWKDILYLLPLQGDTVLKLNPQTDEITRFALTPKFDFFERKSHFYNGWAKDLALPYVILNGKRMKYLAQLPYDYSLADIDLETGEISNRRKWYADGAEDLFRQKGQTATNVLFENPYYALHEFLDDLSAGRRSGVEKKQDSAVQNIHADGTSGKAIYDYVKKLAGV